MFWIYTLESPENVQKGMDSKTQLSECTFRSFQEGAGPIPSARPDPESVDHAGDIPTGSSLLWPSCWVLMWEAAEVATGKASGRANAANSSEGHTKLIRPTKPSLLAGG